MQFTTASCSHHGPEQLHWLLAGLLIPRRLYIPRSPSQLTMSAQLTQLAFSFIYLPIFSFFSVLTWFLGSLCLALKIHIIHGHKVCCLFGRKQAVSLAMVFGCPGCITCTGSIFRADFLFMHDLSQLSLGYPKNLGALTDAWLQINTRR